MANSGRGESWCDITPNINGIVELTGMDISWDNYLFVSTIGTPIIRSANPIGVPSSTEDLNLTEIAVYPNPTASQISIELDRTDNRTLGYELRNIEGSLISAGIITSSQTNVPVAELPDGMYFISFLLEGRVERVQKVVVSK